MDIPQLDAKVLIVDDEPGIRSGVRRVLTGCGAQVEQASNGAEALERLTAEEDFDVAIIDLLMPALDGMGVLTHLADNESTVVPLVITAHATIETAIEAMRLGAYDYLPKPFVPMELIVRVERALRWRRLRQQADRLLLEVSGDKTRLKTIVDCLADAVIVVNVENQVVLSNPAACEILGLPEPPQEPCPLDIVSGTPALLELIRKAAQAEGPACSASARLEIADRIYLARVVPIIPSGDGLLGTATVLRDVTDLTRLEQAKSQFMSLVAHELKSPLAAVQGFLKVILGGQELPPEKETALLQRCSERMEGMAQLVRDLLDLSRADAAPARRIEPLAVEDLLQELVEANDPLAERYQVTVETHLEPHLPPLYADRDDMLRLFGNLLSNALKYNRPGGRVSLTACRRGESLALEVQDTGLGIPPEALSRLGEEFYRVNAPDRRGIVGTGLGLSLVKRTLAAYGGNLCIQSTPGEGSRFTVEIPWEPPSPE